MDGGCGWRMRMGKCEWKNANGKNADNKKSKKEKTRNADNKKSKKEKTRNADGKKNK